MQEYEKILRKMVERRSGMKKNDAAVLIPSVNQGQVMAEHLRRLARQTTAKFDVLVLGDYSGPVPKELNLILYREKYPLGSSGGFGIGQLLAYSLGYRHVISTDTDYLLVSRDAIERLVASAERQKKAVFPIPRLADGREDRHLTTMNRYALVPREVMESVGFEYVPFFKGGEDRDYHDRLEDARAVAYEGPISIEEATLHKPTSWFDISVEGTKHIYYFRSKFSCYALSIYSSLAHGKLSRAAGFFAILCYMSCYFFAISFLRMNSMLGIMLDGISLNLAARYGKSMVFEIPRLEKTKGMVPIRLDAGSKAGAVGNIYPERDHAGKVGIGAVRVMPDKLQLALAFVSIISKRGDYFAPSKKFVSNYYSLLLPMLVFKPVKYLDDRLYGWKPSALYPLEILAALPPFFLLAMLSLLFGMFRMLILGDYPPMPQNVGRMLLNFHRAASKSGRNVRV